MTERYWVVGGDYTCMGFKNLRDGQGKMIGPFDTRDDAVQAWRQVSDADRSKATARYSITSEQLRLPQ
ncbi:hypothetical protein [Caulobacter sp. 17J80-11]|uniref:DUF4170 domain-containing protein n=1 Tax=Caulobacter sp. 17J80-11 TaxID=2763502 RepID=UPI001653D177|nr:hypothetical protein [Caulobacter sp. 17J80-11]MBC6983215.1 hypothetical protein [Caulobacter sp. 17J80-11]